MSNATDLIVWGVIAHLVADWLLQNDYMARHKSDLKHPAAWLHATIHAVASVLVFGWLGFVVAAVHILIDTRKPLGWWSRVFRQTTEGPYAIPVAIWSDQALHVVVIAIVAILAGL